MQHKKIYHGYKNGNFQIKNCDYIIFAPNIDCGYTLEPPHCGCSNEYQRSMFESLKKLKYMIGKG